MRHDHNFGNYFTFFQVIKLVNIPKWKVEPHSSFTGLEMSQLTTSTVDLIYSTLCVRNLKRLSYIVCGNPPLPLLHSIPRTPMSVTRTDCAHRTRMVKVNELYEKNTLQKK